MQWGFTVWSWWLLWARSVANKVQDYAKSETFLECSIGLWTEQGLPVVTPEDAEYGRKGLPAEQRWLVSTEELDRLREEMVGWYPFRRWLKAQWTQCVREVLLHDFQNTKKYKEHKLLEKEVAEQVWAAVRSAPEFRVFDRAVEVVWGAQLGAVTRRKTKKMLQEEEEEMYKQVSKQLGAALCSALGIEQGQAGGGRRRARPMVARINQHALSP